MKKVFIMALAAISMTLAGCGNKTNSNATAVTQPRIAQR
jgi:uncharacterized lipoprotein NlpE involved in copper resistance